MADAVCDSDEVLVCKLVEGKVTYVHRRLWPALVKLASRFRKEQLVKVCSEHTRTGAHRSRMTAVPEWVPRDVLKEAERLWVVEAERIFRPGCRWAKNARRMVAEGQGARWTTDPMPRYVPEGGTMIRNVGTAEHYDWGVACDGWRLLDRPDLSVIQERVPPGEGEVTYYHDRARHLFYVVGGAVEIEVGDQVFRLSTGDSLEVPPGDPHRIRNRGDVPAWFLVISAPTTLGDRTNVESGGRRSADP